MTERALDPLTKCIPVFQLGPRTRDMAYLLIHRLRALLARGCLPSFTSDGLNACFYALTAHFGDWITEAGTRWRKAQWQVKEGLPYGQVQKSYRRRKLVRVRHVIRLGTWSAFKEALQALGFSGRVNTAFIERVNLTIRRGVAALARRTWATAFSCVTARAGARASRSERAEETEISATHARYGGRANEAPMDDAAPPQVSRASAPWVSRQG